MDIRPFSAGDAKMWDDFVSGSRNGTFFHTRRFLGYHPEGKFQDASLLFLDSSGIQATLSAAIQDIDGKKFLVSHPGASYGGLALSAKIGMKETGEILSALKAYAQEQKYDGIRFLRLTPPSVRREFSDDQEYWMFHTEWKTFRIELATSLSLIDMQEDTVLEHFSGKCRNMVRQAERAGLAVRETDDFASFWPILEGMLGAKHASRPTHSLEEITRLKSLCPQDVLLFGAYLGDQMVAGIVGIVLGDLALYTLYMAQDYTHQNIHPLHLLVSELAKTCISEGRRVLHFGISTEDGGTVVNDGLFFFKESFGGTSVRRESWEYTLS